MLEKIPSKRLSARQAVQHQWFRGREASAAENVASRINSAVDGQLQQLAQYMPASRQNSLSEAELYNALQQDEQPPPPPSRYMPRTVAWWQERSVRACHLTPNPFAPAVLHVCRQHRLTVLHRCLSNMTLVNPRKCVAEAARFQQRACQHDARRKWQQGCQTFPRSRWVCYTASNGLFFKR